MNTESYSIQWSQQRTLATLRTSPAWVPHLQLTDEERYVVETKGTVLLLGRSGTGKTICICNRMDYDRQRMAHDSSFTQLFVARSQRLCRYVSETISVTPQYLLHYLWWLADPAWEHTAKSDECKRYFLIEWSGYWSSSCVDQHKILHQGIDRSDTSASAHNWERRFFIIGALWSKRCRLSLVQREVVYNIYERYNN